MNYNEVVEQLKEALGEENYTFNDLSNEEYREYMFPHKGEFFRYRINKPLVLVMRNGGSTHRVVDSSGVTHCVPRDLIFTWHNPLGSKINF